MEPTESGAIHPNATGLFATLSVALTVSACHQDAQYAGRRDETGIYIAGLGVGASTYDNDELMNTVTDVGKGAAVFIDSAEVDDRVFDQDLLSTFEVAARNVQCGSICPRDSRLRAPRLRPCPPTQTRSKTSTSPRTTAWCSTKTS